MSMHEEARIQAYRLLPAPLPIQRGDPHPTTSLLPFTDQKIQESFISSRDNEELCPIADRLTNRKNIHHIGQSLPALFATPIYKCHQSLETTTNNKFCSWSTDQNYKINTVHHSYAPQTAISFQSRFQSGNLGIVSMAEDNSKTYYLALQRDVNSTSGTTQWFYFRVNVGANVGIYTFHIVNFVKPFSMFRIGMKPCVFSPSRGHKWERGGIDIEYRKNTIPYEESESYYTLSFSYEFQQGQGDVYFSYCFPYTYSRLQRFLDTLQAKNLDKMRRKVITKTLGGNVVELISITNPQILNKRILYITARTHPGETVSSFVCEAIIQFLLSNDVDAEKLRDQFIIKVVPMLNPDGVVNGSYRCSLSGCDLNRQWKNPNKTLHPQVYHLKKIILQSEYKKLLFVDIHGHSKKKASFMYGCVSSRSPYLAKQLPYILSRRMNHFNYFTCNFAIPKSKEGTSRITLWRAGIEHSYTYEVSFCGPQKERRHFTIPDLMGLGLQLCRTLSLYFYSRILQLQVDDELNRHCEEFYNDEELLNIGNQQTNGSSSELEDELPHEDLLAKTKSKTFRRTARPGHNATEKTQSGRLNDLLDQYMRKQAKKSQQSQQMKEKQRNAEKDIYLRQRQSFMATRVNIQQIQTDSLLNMSTYYGFAVEKHAHFLQQGRSASLRSSAELALQHSQRTQKNGQSFGILLPNVQKNQYKRYQRPQRYKKEKNIGDRSVSVYVQNLLHAQLGESKLPSPYQTKLNREISLGERIRSRMSDKF